MVKVLVAGDFAPQDRVQFLIEEGCYETVLGNIKKIIDNVDYSIVNFETCVTSSEDKPIKKCGPNLKTVIQAIECLKWCGFDCVTLANNHFADYGSGACRKTIKSCERHGIDIVGGGNSIEEASRILYKCIKGKIIAIINCCEHEFSTATKGKGGANPLNPIKLYYIIKEAHKNADYILIIVHGGHEMYQLPSLRMKETYRFFIDAGADAVVNHHQHCYSGYEVYKEKPIFYGIGNFLFDSKIKRNSIWNEGYMVELCLEDRISFNIIPYEQCSAYATVIPMSANRKILFDIHIKELNDIINDSKRLKVRHEEWMKNNSSNYHLALTPYNNRIMKALYVRALLPDFLPQKKILKLINYIECESHRDRLLNFLYNKIQDK